MESKIQKWGNSLGIRIPSSMLKSMGLKSNDIIDISEEDGKIIITRSNKNKISLQDLFDQYKGSNLAKDFEWDEPRGREVW